MRKKTTPWFGSAANLRKLSADELNIRVGQSVVKPVSPESWCSHQRRVIDARPRLATGADVLFHLRRLRSERHQLGQDVTERLVCALVLSRLNYCNTVLAGLPASTLAPFATLGTLNSEVGYELALGTSWLGYDWHGTTWLGY